MFANPGTSGNADHSGHGAVVTYLDVVANLDQIIQFHAIANNSAVQRSPIDGGVGANFHIIAQGYTTQLRNAMPHAFFVSEAKTIRTDNRTTENMAALPNHHIVGQGYPGAEYGMIPDTGPGTNTGTGTYYDLLTNTGLRLNNHVGADAGRR